jgi:hypothetical protein
LSGATGNFLSLGEVLLEPVGSLVDQNLLPGRSGVDLAVVTASRGFQKRILRRHIPQCSRSTYKLVYPNLLPCEDLRVREKAEKKKK